MGTRSKCSFSPEPLALYSVASTTPSRWFGPPLELKVRLELADHAFAAALGHPLGYNRAVVAYPERDGAFEGGAVAGYVGWVPYHVAWCRVIDLHQLFKRNAPVGLA